MVMTKHQEIMDFHYERDNGHEDGLGVCIDNEVFMYYPFSFTINECLEDYCTGVGLDFHHIQFGARLEEGYGRGRFYYYRMVLAEPPPEPPPQGPPDLPLDSHFFQTNYAWTRRRNERGERETVITLGNGTIRILPAGPSIQDNLRELCRLRGWTFVSRHTCYADFDEGNGYLRYQR